MLFLILILIMIMGNPQFINNNSFFYFCNRILKLYEIQKQYNNNYIYKDAKSINLDYNYEYATIIDLNKNFFCLNDGNKILLLNKENLTLSKTICNNVNILGLLKISDNNITILESKNQKLILNNYEILLDGLNWNLKGTKNILKEEVYNIERSNNYFLCKTNRACILFEIKNKI